MKIAENYRCHSETVRCSHIKPIDRRNCISNDSLDFSHFIRKTEWQTDKESRLSFRCYRVYFWSCAFQVVVMTIRLHHNFQIRFVLNVLEEAWTHTCQKNWNKNTQSHWYMRPNETLCSPVCHHSTYTRTHAHIDAAKNESLYVLYAVQMYWCREDIIKGMNAPEASVVDAIINSHLISYEINKMIKTIKSIIFNGRFNQFAKLHHFRYRCEPLYIVISFYLLWINNKHWWAMLKLQHKRAIHIQREVNNYCK